MDLESYLKLSMQRILKKKAINLNLAKTRHDTFWQCAGQTLRTSVKDVIFSDVLGECASEVMC